MGGPTRRPDGRETESGRWRVIRDESNRRTLRPPKRVITSEPVRIPVTSYQQIAPDSNCSDTLFTRSVPADSRGALGIVHEQGTSGSTLSLPFPPHRVGEDRDERRAPNKTPDLN